MRVVDQDADTDVGTEGILTDWDMSKHKDQLSNDATQDGRSVSIAHYIVITICC